MALPSSRWDVKKEEFPFRRARRKDLSVLEDEASRLEVDVPVAFSCRARAWQQIIFMIKKKRLNGGAEKERRREREEEKDCLASALWL